MTEKETGKPIEVFEIEQLAERYKTPRAVLAGLMKQSGWKTGKRVTEEEYRKAASAFSRAVAGGRG